MKNLVRNRRNLSAFTISFLFFNPQIVYGNGRTRCCEQPDIPPALSFQNAFTHQLFVDIEFEVSKVHVYSKCYPVHASIHGGGEHMSEKSDFRSSVVVPLVHSCCSRIRDGKFVFHRRTNHYNPETCVPTMFQQID